MTIKPLYDRVVIQRLAAETTSKGGIVIPDKAAEKSTQGTVRAVGEGALLESGETRALAVKVGDRVLFSEHAGTEVKNDGEIYLVIKESEILAIIETTDSKEKAA